ncbi:MAG: hypothetical protein LC627_03580 [Verrucomicrobiaceae bacterium]|nr:hypothetical protein [Verrucomicrobiaceae bacterium]
MLLLLSAGTCFAQEITIEEVRVESVFISPLELPSREAVDQLIERLRLQEESARELELRAANQSSVTALLELTRYSPINLGASEPRADTFMQPNYMRADLNPRETNPLFAAE